VCSQSCSSVRRSASAAYFRTARWSRQLRSPLGDDTGGGIPPRCSSACRSVLHHQTCRGRHGLGLALVHGIVADFGGVIDVATQLGAGTTFAIWLPAADQCQGSWWNPQANCREANGEAVMIVDDERPLVELAEETLAALGYEPVGFDSSIAALRRFARNRIASTLCSPTRRCRSHGTELASRSGNCGRRSQSYS